MSTGPPEVRRSNVGRARAGITGAAAAVLGLVPHVLHHAGPIAGAAVLTGAGGTFLFGLLGLALSIPFLLRLRRRFGTWRAPGIALAVFAAMFALSSFVIGPALFGEDGGNSDAPTDTHEEHHG